MRRDSISTKSFRITSLVAGVVFLFFLIDLMPHRVHHMFDEDAANTCIAFTISKGCTLDTPSVAYFSLSTTTSALLEAAPRVWISYLSPSPFRTRAPPTA